MKKLTAIFIAAVLSACFCVISSAQTKDESKRVIGKDLVLINTTTLCEDVEGYIGPTPVQIKIQNDTIRDIIALQNEESPAYFKEAVKVLKKWIGLTPAKGLEIEVDAISGATFTSEALIENVKAGLKKALEE